MKKFLLLALVVVGGVMQASAAGELYLRCDGVSGSWSENLSNWKFEKYWDDYNQQDVYTFILSAVMTLLDIPETTDAIGRNLLVATTSETTVYASTADSYNYMLSNGSNGVGFYNVAYETTSAEFKAYLHTEVELTNQSSARASWLFEDDEATGINTVKNKMQSNEVYNLNGQRVNNAVRGLYIVNGKKVIMK